MIPFERETLIIKTESSKWFETNKKNFLPSEDCVIPIYCTCYRKIALAAWRESRLYAR